MKNSEFSVRGIIEIGSRGLRMLVAERRSDTVQYLHSSGKILNLAENLPDKIPSKDKLQEASEIVANFTE